MDSAGTSLDLNGYDTTLTSLSGFGTITDNSSAYGTTTLTIDTSAGSFWFQGQICDGAGFSQASQTGRNLAIYKFAPTTLPCSGQSTYTGGTNVASGEFDIGQASSVPRASWGVYKTPVMFISGPAATRHSTGISRGRATSTSGVRPGRDLLSIITAWPGSSLCFGMVAVHRPAGAGRGCRIRPGGGSRSADPPSCEALAECRALVAASLVLVPVLFLPGLAGAARLRSRCSTPLTGWPPASS